MAQLSLLGYPKILVGHYDRKDAVKAATVEEAKELANAYFDDTEPYVLGYNNDVLVFAINEADEFDMDDLFYVIVD